MYRLFADWSIKDAHEWMELHNNNTNLHFFYRPHGPVLPWYIKITTQIYTDVSVQQWLIENMPQGVYWWVLKDLTRTEPLV